MPVSDSPLGAGIEGDIRNLRDESHVELKQANNVYNECFTKQFLPGWLKGDKLDVSEVCGSQYDAMMELHSGIYAESPMPFKTYTLPQ